ncbi:hypothetical protein [Candidatus Poriferisocius sp.]|uniref:hypothetical protein n=1 Tax=Candidatus Poriferisocius sp. TaxID=3101276 RepID=UPI003B5170EF
MVCRFACKNGVWDGWDNIDRAIVEGADRVAAAALAERLKMANAGIFGVDSEGERSGSRARGEAVEAVRSLALAQKSGQHRIGWC